jgi:phosphatidate phosphatase APP1
MNLARAIGWLAVSSTAACAAGETRLKPDEQIVFYPAIAQRTPDRTAWRVKIRGRVFEPEKRAALTTALREALALKDVAMTREEASVFNERARLFLADHERGKRIFVRFGSQTFPVGTAKADGTFAGEVRLPDRETPESARWIFDAALPRDDRRVFQGQVFKLEATGMSVISDIDDTIKLTEVHDRRAMLRNTFLRAFAPVPGMAEFYQRLAHSQAAQFHYVSASPWQLYEPLADFLNAHGFPPGTFALKEFRWKNRTFLSLFTSPARYKPAVIEPLLRAFPRRRFVLIGDSGERDPEVYGALARKFPRQIARIYIRDVTGEPADAPRYKEAFRSLPSGLWRVFRTPEELDAGAALGRPGLD